MLKVWNAALILRPTACVWHLPHTLRPSYIGAYLQRIPRRESTSWFIAMSSSVLRASGMASRPAAIGRHLESMLSRESMFLFNNRLFTGICFTVSWEPCIP